MPYPAAIWSPQDSCWPVFLSPEVPQLGPGCCPSLSFLTEDCLSPVQAAGTEYQTEWLVNNRNLVLTVLEAGSPRLGASMTEFL